MKLLLILLTSLILAGCPDPTIITKIKYIEITKPPAPKPLNLGIPYFYVVSDKNKEEFLLRIKKESNGVFWALAPMGYGILVENTQEYLRYIKDSKASNKYCEDLLSVDPAKIDE